VSLARSSLVVASFTTAGVALGFAATLVTAAAFGASREMDTYLAAIAIPSYIVTILTGALGITFIPVFAEYRQSDPALAWRTVSAVFNLSILVTGVLVALCMIAALPIMRVAAPGFTPDEQVRAALILRLYLPVLVVVVVNELLASVYYSHHLFAIPLLNRVIAPVVTIVCVLLLGARLSIVSLVIATLTGAVIQCGLLALGMARRPEFRFVLTTQCYNEGVRKVLLLMAPLVVGMLASKILPVFDRFILSALPAGSIAYVSYASRLQGAVVQILSSSIVLPVFPVLAILAAERRWPALKETISKVVRVTFFVAVPIAVLFGFLGEPLVRLAFQRGAFQPADTHAVFLCTVVYMASLPVVAIGGLVSQGLYVLQDTRSVALVGLGETVLYAVLCYALIGSYQYLAPVIAYGVYFAVSVLVLGVVLRAKLGLGGGAAVASSGARSVGLGIAVGVVAFSIRHFTVASDATQVIWFGLLIVVYFAGAHVLKSPEAAVLWENVHAGMARLRRA